MESEDPIQQLLKNTGWTCDDLLQKLQQYKSQKDSGKKEDPVSSKETTNINPPLAEECVVDSTEGITDRDVAKVQNLQPQEDSSGTAIVFSVKGDKIVTNSRSISEDFSDTDEDEVEVNVTNSNIINEIIDDIFLETLEETQNTNVNFHSENSKPDETTEVTEVRVIEVNTVDDDDDCFDEDDFRHNTAGTSNSSKVEYLETYPRKFYPPLQHNIAEKDVEFVTKEVENSEVLVDSNKKLADSNRGSDLKDKNENFVEVNEKDDTSDSVACETNDNFVEINETNSTSDSVASETTKVENRQKNLHSSVLNIEENNTHTQPDENDTQEETPVKNLEDIRNNLKLQLSCLRTRKKGHFLQELRTKVTEVLKPAEKIVTSENSDISHIPSDYTETSDKPENSAQNNDSNANSDINDISIHTNIEGDSLYTQTNELGLVILNVQGGVDIDSIDNESKTNVPEANINENSSTTINSILDNSTEFNDSNSFPSDNNVVGATKENDGNGVFDEIRKIIRKQKDTSKKEKGDSVLNTNKDKPKETIDNFEFFTGSAKSQSTKGKLKNYEKSKNTGISTENSRSSFCTEDTRHPTDKTSPFVSNTLDEFLTENSKLNISYKVPKCGAEEGLTDNYHREESPMVLKKVVKIDQSPEPKKAQKIKAKTVAQKRKMLEKQRLKELKKSQLESPRPNSPKEKPKCTNANIEMKDSFILINNEKIWVKSTTGDTCIAKLKSPKPTPTKKETSSKIIDDRESAIKISHPRRKPSLLTDLQKKNEGEVKYLPGPLSRKPNLQVSGQENWETETKMLPKILLEVTPKIGEPISKNVLRRLPRSSGKLTESQIEFALSVLKTKNDPPRYNTFRFPLAYSNKQENIIVRKYKRSPIKCTGGEELCEEQKGIKSIVANVIDNLIRYVEIKEIAPTLIKEEETQSHDADDTVINMPVVPENISNIFKKPPKKKSRIELELSRLSCKVVNVEVEENLTEELCNKPYCKLGCVCKSLKCERNISYHCQNVECMLECTCPKEKSIVYDKLTLPAGTDVLSTDAVNRIEDEAKRDLAKVEREFTQTVIHTSDKTIIVGAGGRDKTRRIKKTPKKFSDYVDNFDSIKEEEKTKEVQKCDFTQKCVVSLEKLNLSGIIPFCLSHRTYNCYCEGKSVHISERILPKRKTTVPLNPISEDTVDLEVEKKKSVNIKVSHKKKVPKPKPITEHEKPHNESNTPSLQTEKDADTKIVSASGRSIRNVKKAKLREDFSYSEVVSFYCPPDCARVRGILNVLQSRKSRCNEKQKYNLQKRDFINNISDADLLKAKVSNFERKPMLEVDLLKNQLIAESQRRQLMFENSVNANNKHKRKQTLEIRSDDNSPKTASKKDLAMQRRKKTGLLTRKNSVVEPVFDGEIIVDDRNMELLKKMGPRTVSEGYARLLPWKALIQSFRNGSIKIWSMIDQPSRLLINKSDKLPPKNYVNITQTHQTSDVVFWILSNKLPPEYHEDHVSFILKQTKDNYEICGLCTKNFREDGVLDKMISSNSSENVNVEEEEKLIPFKHRDLNGVQQLLHIKKQKYKLQELIEENLAVVGEDSVDKNKLYMWAALPEIYRVCKWRVIYLNSDFTYLYFTCLKYSIKYTDLVSIGNIAKSENCTVLLRNELMQGGYDHTAFGIYFDAHYQDRLFVGPYFKQYASDDIETLRYINKSLVCTESFNKMQGKMDYKCGHWLIERPYGQARRRPEVVDLTGDSEAQRGQVAGTCMYGKRRSSFDTNQPRKRSRYNHKQNENEQIVIMHNNDRIKVIDAEPRKPEDFNRYIITNIPHFGYLGAHQHSNSTEIDVSWPFENKLLRFSKVQSALDFLQERFSSLLQPIPETFKINVIVLTHIDLTNSHPINANILSGHYICGDFGCYNVKTITDEFCVENLGTTRTELLKIFAKRAQAFIRKKIEELAALLSINQSDLGRYDIVNILEMTKKEIEQESEKEKCNIAIKNDLLLQKRQLALRVFGMISALPEEQKLLENLKFRRVLSKCYRGQPKPDTEPIEIHDSDEESQSGDTSKSPRGQEDPLMLETYSIFDQNTKEVLSVPTASMDTSNVHVENVPNFSLLKDKIVPSKVTETVSTFPPSKKLKLKSVLKPKSKLPALSLPGLELSSPLAKANSDQTTTKIIPSQSQFLTGVKIVKTSSGKLMLVRDSSDKTANKPLKLPGAVMGTQVIIKNNKILSVKSFEMAKKASEPSTSVTETISNKIDSNTVDADKSEQSDENTRSIINELRNLQNCEINNESGSSSVDEQDKTEISNHTEYMSKNYNSPSENLINKTDFSDNTSSSGSNQVVTDKKNILIPQDKVTNNTDENITDKNQDAAGTSSDCIDESVIHNENDSKNLSPVSNVDISSTDKTSFDGDTSSDCIDQHLDNNSSGLKDHNLDNENNGSNEGKAGSNGSQNRYHINHSQVKNDNSKGILENCGSKESESIDKDCLNDHVNHSQVKNDNSKSILENCNSKESDNVEKESLDEHVDNSQVNNDNDNSKGILENCSNTEIDNIDNDSLDEHIDHSQVNDDNSKSILENCSNRKSDNIDEDSLAEHTDDSQVNNDNSKSILENCSRKENDNIDKNSLGEHTDHSQVNNDSSTSILENCSNGESDNIDEDSSDDHINHSQVNNDNSKSILENCNSEDSGSINKDSLDDHIDQCQVNNGQSKSILENCNTKESDNTDKDSLDEHIDHSQVNNDNSKSILENCSSKDSSNVDDDCLVKASADSTAANYCNDQDGTTTEITKKN